MDSPVGEVINNRISVDDVISKLKDADFKILTWYVWGSFKY